MTAPVVKVTEVVGFVDVDALAGMAIEDSATGRGVYMSDILPEGVEGKRGRFVVTVVFTPELLRPRRPLRNRRLLFVIQPLRAHPLQFLRGKVAQIQREPDARLRRRLGPASRRRDLVGHAAR